MKNEELDEELIQAKMYFYTNGIIVEQNPKPYVLYGTKELKISLMLGQFINENNDSIKKS